MDGVNLENDVKCQIHEPLYARAFTFNRIIVDNVLITFMNFYKNYMATLVAMATVHKKIK